MTDYIRKAVELADGWRLSADAEPLIYLADEIHSEDMSFMSWNYPQWMLDALAAQLVRQVDALTGGLELVIFEDETDIFDQANSLAKALAPGEDRTMNTIKAIVESGVLDKLNQEVK